MPGRTLHWNGKGRSALNRKGALTEEVRSAVMAETGRHVSHELRTTLAAIQESAALLREEKSISLQQIRLLEILIRNINRLNGFVSELLAHSESYK